MNWYLQNGKKSDVVISSRIRLARNIQGLPYIEKCNQSDLKKVYDLMKDASITLGYGLKFIALKDMDMLTKNSLVEKHIISPSFAKNNNSNAAIVINDE